MERVYACIDLKSFYASVECNERDLDPLKTNLVVADIERTKKTICLAVSPSLKKYGLKGRCRLFEVEKRMRIVNEERRRNNKQNFTGSSFNSDELASNLNLKIDYIVAKPRMSYYMKYSTKIYNIYKKYISADDIYVYSIDEVFCDLTDYLHIYKLDARELVTKIIHDVYNETGITATAGIGTNLYLAKVAMDIVAKKCEPDNYGVRIAFLSEKLYREQLWGYESLTSFWRVGPGIAKKLSEMHIYTMGDLARFSLTNEDKLYKVFGINAELLIDHAWGYETCTIASIKNYQPQANCLTQGQVLHCAYDFKKARLIVSEMADLLSLDLVEKRLITDKIVLTIGYDMLDDFTNTVNQYNGDFIIDNYGRNLPKPAHGTATIDHKTSSAKKIINATIKLYDSIVNENLLIKRINLTALNVVSEDEFDKVKRVYQYSLFSNNEEINHQKELENIDEISENKLQHTIIAIKKKYGKNALLRGVNFLDGSTMRERNDQIGGHHK